VYNARRADELPNECGSLAGYFWRWESEPTSRPGRVTRAALSQLARTPESTALSKDLKRPDHDDAGHKPRDEQDTSDNAEPAVRIRQQLAPVEDPEGMVRHESA
jgi:hypothetical protein